MFNSRTESLILLLTIASFIALPIHAKPKRIGKADITKGKRKKPKVKPKKPKVKPKKKSAKKARNSKKKRTVISIGLNKNTKSKRPAMRPRRAPADAQCARKLMHAQKRVASTALALRMCHKGLKAKDANARELRAKIDKAVKANERQRAISEKEKLSQLAGTCQQIGMNTCSHYILNKISVKFENVQNPKQAAKDIKAMVRTVCKKSVMAGCSSVEGWRPEK